MSKASFPEPPSRVPQEDKAFALPSPELGQGEGFVGPQQGSALYAWEHHFWWAWSGKSACKSLS